MSIENISKQLNAVACRTKLICLLFGHTRRIRNRKREIVTSFGYRLLGATPLSFSAMLSSANKADLKPNS